MRPPHPAAAGGSRCGRGGPADEAGVGFPTFGQIPEGGLNAVRSFFQVYQLILG